MSSTGKTDDIDLADTPDPQEVHVANGAGATSVELDRLLNGDDAVVSEVEFFGPG